MSEPLVQALYDVICAFYWRPEKTIDQFEALDRATSAIKNSGLPMPTKSKFKYETLAEHDAAEKRNLKRSSIKA